MQIALAQWVSAILNPLSVVTMVIGAIILWRPIPLAEPGPTLAICLGFGVILPAACVGFLLKKGKIDRLFVEERSKRKLPLILTSLCCTFGLVVLDRVHAPADIAAIFQTYAVLAFVTFLTGRWRVSLHSLGIWGALAVLTYIYGQHALLLTPFALVVSWARVVQNAHTLGQVCAGGILGSGLTWLVCFVSIG